MNCLNKIRLFVNNSACSHVVHTSPVEKSSRLTVVLPAALRSSSWSPGGDEETAVVSQTTEGRLYQREALSSSYLRQQQHTAQQEHGFNIE